MVDGIDPKSISTFFQPVLENVQHFLVHYLVTVVQVWLFLSELMKVALSSGRVIGPSASVEHSDLNFALFLRVGESGEFTNPVVRVP